MSASRLTLWMLMVVCAAILASFLPLAGNEFTTLSVIVVAWLVSAYVFGTAMHKSNAVQVKRAYVGAGLGALGGLVVGSLFSSHDAQGGLLALMTAPLGFLLGASVGLLMRTKRPE